ncbi:MAG: ABC transporter permease [Armatimonadetes bacterium]|nr:ABC transporter permease [Armatimonadota bacterium]
MNGQRILQLARKEFLQIRRDPIVLRMVIALPLIQLMLIGFVAQMDVEHIPTAICDEDRTAASRALAREIDASRYFRVVAIASDHRAVKPLVDRAVARVALVVPRGYSEALASGRQAQIGMVLDGADATTARIAAGYLQQMLLTENLHIVRARLRSRGARVQVPPVELRSAIWYNPNLRSRDYMVPGVVGVVILVLSLTLTSVAIVREREMGTLERLIMAPFSPVELLLGKLLPYLVMVLIDAAVILVLARVVFQVPLCGNPLFLYASSVLFAVNCLGVGLFASSLAQTQQQAILTNVFFIMPSILMSGFIAPIRNMPLIVQYLTYAIPLRYFLTLARGVWLKGLTPPEVLPQLAALAGLTVLVLAGGALMMRRRL